MDTKELDTMNLANYLKVDTDQGGIMTVTLNRLGNPNNQFNTCMIRALDSVLRPQLMEPSARAIIIISSRPKVFSTGADIEGDMANLGTLKSARFCQTGQTCFDLLGLLDCPTLAAISGFTLGGGCELALACDFRLAHKNSRIGLPEINLGVLPGWGGTQRLPRLIGQPRAMKMILSGDPVNAATALEYGLVDQITETYEELIPAAKKLLSKFTRKSRSAIALAKRAIVQGGQVALDSGLKMESKLFALAWSTPDREEGLAAYLSKRKPKWSD